MTDSSAPLQVRRVVDGPDADGKAVVCIDETSTAITSRRPGHVSAVIWTTDKFPSSNDDDFDGSLREVGTANATGSVFRVARLDPGVAGRIHRTQSLDYAVVLSGEVDMALDNDVEVRLRAGDVLVQRGTIHNWINRGSRPCTIAFVLLAAYPVTAVGHDLQAVG